MEIGEIKEIALVDDLVQSATVVIASEDSYNSDSADIVIQHSEDTGKILTETVDKLSDTGGLVQFLEGTYYFDSKGIIQTDNITINGIYRATKFIARDLDNDGRGAIIEVGEDDSGDIENQVDGFKISNVSVKGTDKGSYRGIALWGATNSVIEYVEVYDNSSRGIQLSSNSSATISNVKSYNNNIDGIATFGDSKATISNVESYNNDTHGIQLSSNSSATISNVKSYNNNSVGIATLGDSKATISNVESYNNRSNGVQFSDNSSALIQLSRVYNNNKRGSLFSDIYLGTSNQVIALNNYIGITDNSSANGFNISASVSNAVITHNVIVDDYSGSRIKDKGKNTITELSGNVGV